MAEGVIYGMYGMMPGSKGHVRNAEQSGAS